MNNEVSIFGNFRKDILYLYLLPAILLVAMMSIDQFWENPVLGIMVLFFLDTGHTYTTGFRTYFRKEEFLRNKTYLIAPIIVFGIVFGWNYSGAPYFWNALIYLTFFHHIRQYYGVFRWYAKLNNYPVKNEHWHLYLLLTIPFVLFHFREINYEPLYQRSEIMFFPALPYFNYLFAAFTCYFLFITMTMVRKYARKEVSAGLLLSFVFPTLLHYICFFFFKHSYQILMPILCIHGLTYLLLINHSCHKLSDTPKNSGMVWAMILGAIILFSGFEYFTIDQFGIFNGNVFRGNMFLCLLISLSLLPNILHYYYDGFLWKKDHPDFIKIMK